MKDFDTSPDVRGTEVILSGLSFVSDDDHQAIARGFIVLDYLYVGLLLRRLRTELKDKMDHMSPQERFQLLFAELRKRF